MMDEVARQPSFVSRCCDRDGSDASLACADLVGQQQECALQSLLSTLSVQVHSLSLYRIKSGCRSKNPGSSEAIIFHYVLSGEGTVQTGDYAPKELRPHSLVIIPRGQSHTIGFASASRMRPAADEIDHLPNGPLRVTADEGSRDMLLACGAITARYAGALGLFDQLQDAVVGDLSTSAHLRHAFSFMVEELAEPGLGTADVIGALMKKCLIVFLRLHMQDQGVSSPMFPALRDPRLADAVAAVIDTPAAPHTVESLAALCGMSRSAFAERFSDMFGEGPIAFLQRARLRLGAQLLMTSPMPVKVIAASVGYASRSHFSHAFRGAYGIDPTTFRRGTETDRHLEPFDGVKRPKIYSG